MLAGDVELGGKTLELTILFCDLRDFTSLSEKRSAHEIVALLNEYFTEMVDCVMAEGGVVDKYIGDNIMAVFGAPVTRARRRAPARCAPRFACARRSTQLNERFARAGMAKLRFGIGLHTGEVVAGNIGSARRMEYTVIGDAVNLASRLESKTKELGDRHHDLGGDARAAHIRRRDRAARRDPRQGPRAGPCRSTRSAVTGLASRDAERAQRGGSSASSVAGVVVEVRGHAHERAPTAKSTIGIPSRRQAGDGLAARAARRRGSAIGRRPSRRARLSGASTWRGAA